MKVIVTGATGMVGDGVLHECLLNENIEAVLSVSRKPTGASHRKLKELIVPDFFDLSAIAGQLAGFDACLFCLGVSSIGMKENEYFRLTHTLTMHFAETLISVNPEMTFCYISGVNTDSTEQKRSMWAGVKGKTENDLQKLAFRAVYHFRPGYLHPTAGLTKTLKAYLYFSWMYALLRRVFPRYVSSLQELGLAMIQAAQYGYNKKIIEVKDIKALAAMQK